MNDSLVYVGRIISLDPIPTADLISSATVVCGPGGKWRGVVRKTDFTVGDKCLVFLPDAIIPENPSMEFLRSSNWRVKMRRFRGAPSEVVIIPHAFDHIGDDLTKSCGVTKYVKDMPAKLAGICKSTFPSFIPKTDEPNWQRCEEWIALLKGQPYYITEKADGSSSTAYTWKGEFGVCSRNYELLESEKNGYWQIANRYNLREKLPEGYAIQWETCGPGIQKNPMGLKLIAGFAFNVFDIEKQQYLDYPSQNNFLAALNFCPVRHLDNGPSFNFDDLTELAKGKYDSGVDREGIVIRSQFPIAGQRISFKAINLDYKD